VKNKDKPMNTHYLLQYVKNKTTKALCKNWLTESRRNYVKPVNKSDSSPSAVLKTSMERVLNTALTKQTKTF